MEKFFQNMNSSMGQFQQSSSPQPIPPTNNVNPTNQGNNNTKGRGRRFYRGRGDRGRGRGQGFYQDRPPICWWCKDNVREGEVHHRIQDCPLYNQCRENWWKTHPKPNSNTTTPRNPEQEKTRKAIH